VAEVPNWCWLKTTAPVDLSHANGLSACRLRLKLDDRPKGNRLLDLGAKHHFGAGQQPQPREADDPDLDRMLTEHFAALAVQDASQ